MRRLLPTVISVAVASLAISSTAQASPSGSARPKPPISAAATISALHTQLVAGMLAQSGQFGVSGCGTPVNGVRLLCNAQFLTQAPGSVSPLSSTQPIGYGPQELQNAYGVAKAAAGSGTVYVVEAGADPYLEADLNTYRAQYGLPACTTANGCFHQENYEGGAPYALSDPSGYIEEELSLETSLDVDMISAGCPACHITEVQTPYTDGIAGTAASLLQTAAHFNTAVSLAHSQGAKAVSISYGLPIHLTDPLTGQPQTPVDYDQYNLHAPGTAVYASTGDTGYLGDHESWPANQDYVIAAGGTSLSSNQKTRTGYAETAWNNGGSGCSTTEGPANGQPATIAANCDGGRASADISAVADPTTGVAVYDSMPCEGSICDIFGIAGASYQWVVVGGTSASSLLLAALNTRAGVQSDVLGPNHIYRAREGLFNDISLGRNTAQGACASDGYSDTVCAAGPGWDGPTGLGSPIGLTTFRTK